MTATINTFSLLESKPSTKRKVLKTSPKPAKSADTLPRQTSLTPLLLLLLLLVGVLVVLLLPPVPRISGQLLAEATPRLLLGFRRNLTNRYLCEIVPILHFINRHVYEIMPISHIINLLGDDQAPL